MTINNHKGHLLATMKPIAALMTLCGALVVMSSAPALAAPLLPTDDEQEPSTVTSAPDNADSQAPEINCELVVVDPHTSGNPPAAITVDSTVHCTGGQPAALTTQVRLWWSDPATDQLVAESKPTTQSGSDQLGTTAEVNYCIPGRTYFGTSTSTVVFPPGYNPPRAILQAKSAEIPAVC